MNWIEFKPELSFSSVLTACAFVFSVITFVIVQAQNRRAQRSKDAAEIKDAAKKPEQALVRWHELALSVFEDVQPLSVDADVMLTKEGNVIAVRDFVWREICVLTAKNQKRIVDENLSGSYADLYGRLPEIQELYAGAIDRLTRTHELLKEHLLHRTQADVTSFAARAQYGPTIKTAELGNQLRYSYGEIRSLWDSRLMSIIQPVRLQLHKVIKAKDRALLRGKIDFPSAADLFADFDKALDAWTLEGAATLQPNAIRPPVPSNPTIGRTSFHPSDELICSCIARLFKAKTLFLPDRKATSLTEAICVHHGQRQQGFNTSDYEALVHACQASRAAVADVYEKAVQDCVASRAARAAAVIRLYDRAIGHDSMERNRRQDRDIAEGKERQANQRLIDLQRKADRKPRGKRKSP